MSEHAAPAPGGDQDSDGMRQERVRALVAECVDRIAEEGSAALDELCRAHPDFAAELRARIAKLQRAGLMGSDAPPRAIVSGEDAIPERLGEFRLIRRLGAGGMGVVYLAEQVSLGRHVALKLVRPELLYFPRARERFQREIEAIARLADPGIVPIHSVGEDSGIPYFAMAWIEGSTLAELIADHAGRNPAELEGRDLLLSVARRLGVSLPESTPDDLRGPWTVACARLVRRMAEALHHAHERGVVHRDIKPSNAMLTLQGRVLLLDFGLAAADGTARITGSGVQLGTLHAMAPEQLASGATDARTDVYALGVLLHELLTLRPPYDAPDAARLRTLIAAGDAPSACRLNRAVPRDLDTIGRRAMDRDPHRRYPSAQDFAEDLGRFLDHRPIHARPAGLWLRARRWSRRHPGWAAATIAGPLLVAGLEFARARSARLEGDVRANAARAMEAIDRLVGQANDRLMLATPGMDRLRLAQLESAMTMLEGLAAENPGSAEVRLALLMGLVRATGVYEELGRSAAAESSQRRVDTELARLSAERPDDDLTAHISGVAATARGELRRRRGDVEGALAEFGAAVRWLERFETRAGIGASIARNLATALSNLGMARQMAGDSTAAETLQRRALAVDVRALGDGVPQADPSHLRLRNSLAVVLVAQGKFEEARQTLESDLSQVTAAIAGTSPDPELRREISRMRINLARILAGTDPARARHEIDAAVLGFDALVEPFPDRSYYAWERNLTERWAGLLAQDQQDHQEAVRRLRSAALHHAELARAMPATSDVGSELAEIRRSLAQSLERSGDRAGARAELDAAVDGHRAMVELAPNDAFRRRQHASACFDRGLLLRRANDPDAALTALKLSMEEFARAIADSSPTPDDLRIVRDAARIAADIAAATDHPDDAVRVLDRLQEIAPLRTAELRALGAQLHLDGIAEFQALLAKTKD
ncbi:MAG: serine/threonine protein kinase [Planctomycetes bacterium]|nr:serine/threonine protein kinase [Planctomycetota bacterium]